MRYLLVLFIGVFCFFDSFIQNATACPKIGNLIDYNCNQVLKIVITGDSIVKGVGGLPEEEGYVARLRERLPKAEITDLGVAGVTSFRLLRAFKKLLSQKKEGQTKIKTSDADIIVVDVGRNDFYSHGIPSLTVNNIRRLVKFLREHVGSDVQSPPYIIVSTLLPTTRRFQQPFIDEVNRLLLKLSSKDFKVLVRFDYLSTDYLSEDGLHPSPEGYIAMGDQLYYVITKPLQKLISSRAKDKDNDGIADYFEVNRYLTNKSHLDTDGDSYSDGSEVFTFGSDPLDPLSTPLTVTPTPTPTN